MGYQFKLTEEKDQPVLSIRTRAAASELPRECGRVYGQLAQYLEEVEEKTEGPAFVAYYNMDMEDLDVEIGLLVPKSIPGKGAILGTKIPEGKQVSCMHKGSYGEVGPAYDALAAWAGEQSLTPTGISYEFYYNSPGEVPESELMTKIIFPVK